MFRVAICDDEKTICSQIEKVILDYQKDCAEEIDVLTFSSGEELHKIIKDGQAFDLIFLDIELDKLNGIEVGKIIREELNDNITQIVYISANKDYAMELFENRPLNFLVKPICCEKIIKNLNVAINLHKNSNLFFEVYCNYNFTKIPYKKIMYFESNDKKINIITIDEKYEYYGKLSELKKEVKEKDFIQIHKSHLVNYQYIVEVSYEKIILTNGEELNISQSYRKEVRNNLKMRRKELYR